MLANNHENQIQYPNDCETEYKADKTCYDFALGESGYPAADPCSDGDYSENNAYDVCESEVITLCHDVYLL